MGDLDDVHGDLTDVAEAQQQMEDLNCRWNLGAVDPDQTEHGATVPFKSSTSWPTSKRKQVGSQSKHAGH